METGQFCSSVGSTKDTVRHYEELGLLSPKKKLNGRKLYTEKEIIEFQVITEMKELGFTLRVIQIFFKLKRSLECGDKKLISASLAKMNEHKAKLVEERNQINIRIEKISGIITEIERL